jgi:hypothetical protein
MLFREFNIIAAAAYAAARLQTTLTSAGIVRQRGTTSPTPRMEHTQRVMAIARGEEDQDLKVFEATTKAILGYNGGQGGLALEELANLGGLVLNLELLTEDQVAGQSIRETIEELLYELQQYRQGGVAATRTRRIPLTSGWARSRWPSICSRSARTPAEDRADRRHRGQVR